MKLNIAYPATGAQKLIDLEDEHKVSALSDKRISQDLEGELLGDEFKGYVFKITGGHDKQGFAMRQGVLAPGRVRLLLPVGKGNRRGKDGSRKRKSVRGCVVAPDLAVLHLVLVKKGEQEIEGLTDKVVPRRLGPKRASKIRKLFGLDGDADVRKYVIRREIKKENGTTYTKAPKIQRLITPARLQHKRHLRALKRRRREKSRSEAAAYAELLQTRRKELSEKRASRLTKKREVVAH